MLADDQSWDSLVIAGNEIIHTPDMDKLAGEGLYVKMLLLIKPFVQQKEHLSLAV